MKQEKTWLSNEAYKKSILHFFTVLPFSRGGWQFVAKTSPIGEILLWHSHESIEHPLSFQFYNPTALGKMSSSFTLSRSFLTHTFFRTTVIMVMS